VKIKKERVSAEYSWKRSWIECVVIGFNIFRENLMPHTEDWVFRNVSMNPFFKSSVESEVALLLNK